MPPASATSSSEPRIRAPRRRRRRPASARPTARSCPAARRFIPGPPPLPGVAVAPAAQLPFPEMGGVLAAIRNATSRDEILELVLTGARMVALRVALFVVKKGGSGWIATPELADPEIAPGAARPARRGQRTSTAPFRRTSTSDRSPTTGSTRRFAGFSGARVATSPRCRFVSAEKRPSSSSPTISATR